MRRLAFLIGVLALFVTPLSGRVVPVAWTVVGVVFDDGGTASGSFTYDATTNTYSNINITTTNGSTRTGANYTFANPMSTNSALVVTTINPASDLTGTPAMVLFFAPPLTDAGGNVTVSVGNPNGSQEVTCPNATCSNAPPTQIRFVTTGGVTTNAVPTMPQWLAIVTGVLLVLTAAWALRRQPILARARQ